MDGKKRELIEGSFIEIDSWIGLDLIGDGCYAAY